MYFIEFENEKAWIVFIELNFRVTFMLIRNTWADQFANKVGGWGI